MSSRRSLKKSINATMDLLFIDCIFYKVFVIDADKEAANKVMLNISKAQTDLTKRISATEGKEVKGRVKAYYKKLRSDIQKQVDTLTQEIADLGK